MPMGRCVRIGSRARDSDVLEALDALHAGVGASIDGLDVNGACRLVRLIRLREQLRFYFLTGRQLIRLP